MGSGGFLWADVGILCEQKVEDFAECGVIVSCVRISDGGEVNLVNCSGQLFD